MKAMAAVSARRMRRPRVMPAKPTARAASNSSGAKPPLAAHDQRAAARKAREVRLAAFCELAGEQLVFVPRAVGERAAEGIEIAHGGHRRAAALLGRLPRDLAQPLELFFVHVRGAVAGGKDVDGGDAELGRLLHDQLRLVPP